VRPNLAVDPDKFLPESVPAFGATEIMTLLRKKYPDYAYKEAALNPTNPRNRAVEWETDIVNAFRADPSRPEISGTRETPTGRSLYLARPFQIKGPACRLPHHAEIAPAAWLKIYGPPTVSAGCDEVIGARSCRCRWTCRSATPTAFAFMSSLAVVFAVLFVILNVMLRRSSCSRSPAVGAVTRSQGPPRRAEFSDKGRTKSRSSAGVQPHAPQLEGDRLIDKACAFSDVRERPASRPACRSTASKGARRRRPG
jgi:hypothetical protein